MKKLILTFALFMSLYIAKAQIKVYTGGKVSVGSTTAPTYNLGVTGDIDAVASGNAYRIQGNKILWYNSTATSNIFVGVGAGAAISSGTYNTFIGNNAGTTHATGDDNTYIGYSAGAASNSAYYNTFVGFYSGYHNTTGYYNTFSGFKSGYSTVGGYSNTFIGINAGYFNTTGYDNTGVGQSAGQTYSGGNNNTFLGYGADVNANSLSNMTAIGNGAIASSTYNFMCGNSTVNKVYSTNGFASTSDGRFKTNVAENVKGLEFIKALRPVTYNLDTKSLDDFIIQNMPDSVKIMHKKGMDFTASMAVVHSGFIAQEVEQAAQKVGYTSSIVTHPANSNEPYALSYEEFVVPLVKAVQELSMTTDSLRAAKSSQRTMQNNKNDPSAANSNKQIESLKAENEKIKKQLATLQQRLEAIEKKK